MEKTTAFQLDMTLTPGDRIRAYDYPGRKDYYIEGEVLEIVHEQPPMITVRCDTDTKPGAPMKGNVIPVTITRSYKHLWGFFRIEKLARKKAKQNLKKQSMETLTTKPLMIFLYPSPEPDFDPPKGCHSDWASAFRRAVKFLQDRTEKTYRGICLSELEGQVYWVDTKGNLFNRQGQLIQVESLEQTSLK